MDLKGFNFSVKGDVLYKAKRYIEALSYYTQALECDEKQDIYYYKRGITYFWLERYTESIADATKAININELNPEYYWSRALAFCTLKKYSEAMNDVKKVIELLPNCDVAYHVMGLLYESIGNQSEALQYFVKSTQYNPKCAQYYYQCAENCLKLGFIDEGIKHINIALSLSIDKNFYKIRAKLYSKVCKYALAIEDYTQFMEIIKKELELFYGKKGKILNFRLCGEKKYNKNNLIPIIPYEENNIIYVSFSNTHDEESFTDKIKELKKAYSKRALLYKDLKEYQKSIEDYTEAIKLDPKHPFYYFARGVIYNYGLKEYKKSIKNYKKAMKLDSTDPLYPYNLGFVYSALGDYKMAALYFRTVKNSPVNADFSLLEDIEEMERLTKLIESEPQNSSHYYDRGLVFHYRLNDYKRAIKDYSQAIKLNPQEPYYYNVRALSFRHLKCAQEAISDYTRAINLRSNKEEYYYERGVTYYEVGEYQNAINDFTQAIHLGSTNIWCYSMRGKISAILGRCEEAISDFTYEINLLPDVRWRYEERAKVYYKLCQYEQAVKDYTKAIELTIYEPIYYYERGNCYLKLEQYQEAIQDYDYVISYYTSIKASNHKAKIYYLPKNNYSSKLAHKQVNQNHQAQVYYLNNTIAATADKKMIADCYEKKGIAYLLMGKHSQAIEHLRYAGFIEQMNIKS